MKFLWYSIRGCGLGLALRVQGEGNQVKWYQQEGRVGEGLVEVVDTPRVEEGTVVVFDGPGAGKVAEQMRKRGVPVVGGSVFGDAVERNRLYGVQLMKSVGVTLSEDEGPEVSIEGWFNGQDWIYHSISSTLEEKRLLTGGLGPNTRCMGNVVFFYRHARPKLAKDTLLKLTGVLRKVGYVGPLGVIAKGKCGLTTRFGPVTVELLDMELGKMLSDVAKGQSRAWRPSFDFGCGVMLSVPPFPSQHDLEYGVHVQVPDGKWFYPEDVQLDESGQLITAGNSAVLGMMTATAPTISEARKLVYERVGRVVVPDLQYRLDMGERAMREVPQLLREVGNEEAA